MVLWYATIFLDVLTAHAIAEFSFGQHMKSEFWLWSCNDTREEEMFYSTLKVVGRLGRKWLCITSWYKENRTVRCSIQWRTKKKSKFVPVDIMEVYSKSKRCGSTHSSNLGARGKWVVNFMPRAPYPCERILVPLFQPGFIPRIFQHIAWSLYRLCCPSPYEQSTSIFNLMGHFRSRIMNVLMMIILLQML
jgi:hypothetical protein